MAVSPRYRGVLFDLFGTLITIDSSRLPVLRIGDRKISATVAGLGPHLARWLPGVGVETFWEQLLAVSAEMAQTRGADCVELPSRERFRRALERSGCDDATLHEAAVDLSRAHMALIVGATVFPRPHAAVLETARAAGAVGLVSNFDDTGAAYEILRRHEILPHMDTVVVSEAIGLRKPHPALVRAGLRGLGLDPADVLFVGDTFDEDVAAARASGVDCAWIDARGRGVPEGETPPRYVLRALTEVTAILEA
jgi:putative hydrolase of the HAD superfamily